MKKFLILLLFLIPLITGVLKAQTPTAPTQMTTASWYYEPSTHHKWVYNGITYGWIDLSAGGGGGGTTTYALTAGYGVTAFTFNGGINGVKVIVDTTLMMPKVNTYTLAQMQTILNGFLPLTLLSNKVVNNNGHILTIKMDTAYFRNGGTEQIAIVNTGIGMYSNSMNQILNIHPNSILFTKLTDTTNKYWLLQANSDTARISGKPTIFKNGLQSPKQPVLAQDVVPLYYANAKYEQLANKATTFGTLNNTLYPTTQAVANYIATATFIQNQNATIQTGNYWLNGTTQVGGTVFGGGTTASVRSYIVASAPYNIPIVNLQGGDGLTFTTLSGQTVAGTQALYASDYLSNIVTIQNDSLILQNGSNGKKTSFAPEGISESVVGGDFTIKVATGSNIIFNGYMQAALPAYSAGTTIPIVYNSTNNRFETRVAGGGTVTNFLFTNGGGFTGTVGTSTTTPTLSLVLQNATTSQSGQLTSTDWNTFNGKGSGTVTSVATSTGILGGTITTTGTLKADTTVLQTVLNFFPKADTRYYKSSNPSGYISTAVTSVATGNGLTGGTITTTGTLKADTSILQTILNFFPKGDTRYAKIGGGTLTNALTFGTGLVAGSFNNSAAVTEKVDTSVMQTVLNFFPKADTRYYTKTSSDAKYALQATTISAGTGLSGGGSLASNRTISADTTVLQTVLNFFPKGDTRYYTKTAADARFSPIAGSASLVTIGTIGTSPYTTAGIIHNSVTTGAFTSSLIVNADITAGTIAFSKLVGTDITTVGTLSAGSIPYSLLTGTPTIPTGANPTASITFTPVNGVAATFTRSDGAPKADSTVIASYANHPTLAQQQTKFNGETLQVVATRGNSYTGQIQAQTFAAAGTGGNGYLDLGIQTASPASLANHLRIYADSLDRLSWKNSLYRRTIRVPYPSDYTINMPYQSTSTILEDSTHSAVTYISQTTGAIAKTTTALMQSYTGAATTIIVTATDGTGGTFNYVASGLTADNGVVFTATGIGSGFWVRQFNLGDGVKIAWYGDTQAGAQAAITYAGVSGKVIFTPNVTYSQTGQLTRLANQTWVGNNATLQRQTETSVAAIGTILSSASSFTVASVPASWHIGDGIQIYIGQASLGSSSVRFINNIVGTTISISGTVGAALYNGATSYASASVWKVWDQVGAGSYCNGEIDNLNFDGNQNTSCPNVYWGENRAIYTAGKPNFRIVNCNFINMGNDCIQGHGLYITGCTYNLLNNAFVHLTADFSVSPSIYPSEIFDNKGTNSNQVVSASGSHHSEGVITLSNTGGYVFIHDNSFKGGLDCFIGQFSMAIDGSSGASRFLRIHHNQGFNLAGVLAGFTADVTETIKPGLAIFDGNNFDNCGTTTPFPATLNAQWAYIDKIVWINNTLSGGTTITIPAEVYSTDNIANVGATANIQTGTSFNIDGNGTLGGTLAVTGTTSLTANVNIGGATSAVQSLGIHKNITGGTTASGIFQDGTIQSGVTTEANINSSRPKTVASSFTVGKIRHYYANGTALGATSAVTNEYGFFAESTITDGASNYGFYGNIASQANTYNFYAAGSALNFFQGATTFATTLGVTGHVTFEGVTSTGATGTGKLVFDSGSSLTGTTSIALAAIGATGGSNDIQTGGTGFLAATTTAAYLPTGVTTIQHRSSFYGNSSTTLAASNSAGNVIFAAAGATTAGSGTSALLANVIINKPAFTESTGSTVTDATTFYIDGAPTLSGAGTQTNAVTAMWVKAGTSKFGGPVQLFGYTVSTLPTGVTGMTAYVTDALTPSFGTTLVGGGAIVTKAFYNGSNWIAE